LEITANEKETVMPNSLEGLVAQYRELKDQIRALEDAKREIADRFRAGLTAFGVDSAQVNVNGVPMQLKLTERETHSCQWAALKELHPAVYEEFVTDSIVTYVDLRTVGNRG
jgi:hypothetical protein